MKKKEIIKIFTGVLLLIVVVAGTTYAAFVWASDPNNGFISGTSDCFVLDYTKGTDILSGELELGSTYIDGLSATVKAKLSDTCNIETATGTLYLNTDDVTSDYLITNKIIRYQVLEDGQEVDGASGTINSKGQTAIYNNIDITDVEKSFTVYIWISIEDATDSNLNDIMSSTFSASIGMKAESR